MEILDIIDEEENVIGQASYDEVHARQLLHRYVQVLVITGDNKLLCQQRSPNVRNAPLTFDASVGEHIPAGEAYIDAAIRGLKEELHYTARADQLVEIGRIENRGTPEKENIIGRLFCIYTNGPFEFEETEIERIEYFERSEIAYLLERFPYLICDNFKASLKLLDQCFEKRPT